MTNTNDGTGSSQSSSQDVNDLKLVKLPRQKTTMERNIANINSRICSFADKIDQSGLECNLQILEGFFRTICQTQTQIEDLLLN